MKYINVIEKAMLQQKPMKGLNIFNIKNKAQLILFSCINGSNMLKEMMVFYIISGSCFESKAQNYRETSMVLCMVPLFMLRFEKQQDDAHLHPKYL